MYDKREIVDQRSQLEVPDLNHERRRGERRRSQSKGYTYISMVGWICRREQTRRQSDIYQG